MNRFIKTLCLLSAAGLMACSNAPNSKAPEDDGKNITQQLEDLKSGVSIDVDNLQGKTDTEKLLYLLDTPTTTKAGILIFLDVQIKTLEETGNKKDAEAMRANRVLLTQAVDENLEDFVEIAAKVYDKFFTEEEVKQLVAIFSQPIMQKYTKTTINLQQELLPVAEAWSSSKVIPRFQELMKERAKK